MAFIILLICIPLVIAGLLLCVRNNLARNTIIIISVIAIAALAVCISIQNFNQPVYYAVEALWANILIFAAELFVALVIIVISIRNKNYLTVALAFIQTAALAWFELSGGRLTEELTHNFFVDKLTIVMLLIVAVVGGLICIYSLSYMKNYHKHHEDVKDRRPTFFAVIFLFFSAMFGLVLSNDLKWVYLFWEITTLCSYLLIGYSKTPEAKKNSATALLYNVIGSVFFAAAIIYLGMSNISELKDFAKMPGGVAALTMPALFLAIAGIAKSAQMPFSKWLLGAMVAPTPTSALLHSSTMVKAGVYLILRMSPFLSGNTAGFFVVLVGGATFLAASLIAITQSDGKKVLAYSTIANLGLIVSCAGIGTYESMWAALFLIIFHAVSKSLMFLSVGSVENLTGSRDIENMHGLIVKLPSLAILMTVGIAGMFLAPFGMLISKWAAMKAFVDSKNIIMLFMLVFGSAATLFYWTKWLGKLVAIRSKSERLQSKPPRFEFFSLTSHAVLTVLICLLFPFVSQYVVEPFLAQMFGHTQIVIGLGNQQIMLLLLGMVLLLPVCLSFMTKGGKISTVYMGGVNEGDDKHFKGAAGETKRMYLSNWYMERYFGEDKLFKPATVIGAALIVIALIYEIGRLGH